jgi:hypothetical protein
MENRGPARKRSSGNRNIRPILRFLVVAVVVASLSIFLYSQDEIRSRRAVTLEYGSSPRLGLGTITHSGETVGQVVKALGSRSHDDGLRALLQPYLEPMSRVIVGHVAETDSVNSWIDLQNYLEEVQARTGNKGGNSRPAWADILSEGRFRILFTADTVAVYVQGKNADEAYRENRALARYPVQYLKTTGLSSCTLINVFAFNNSYEDLQVTLDSEPYPVRYEDLAANTGKAALNLDGLAAFFQVGAVPEAIEISEDGEFFLYGRKSNLATMAGKQLSLSDLAVAYRAVFWPGFNEPYVSLDRHEDNRYAKVNFGGLLQDTQMGQVVLDADRYFKTLSTGLDPFERRNIQDQIRESVPGFLPSDAQELLDGQSGSAEFRYWFYPDSLRVTTDGGIGVVTACQFYADVERQDQPVAMSAAQKFAIGDLNRRYGAYKLAIPTYAELDNVGRLLGLMYWLKESGAARAVDLEGLLSVTLPSWKTERRTSKMLAVTSFHGPERYGRSISTEFLRRTRVFDFSDRLQERSPFDHDHELLQYGSQCFEGLSPGAYACEDDLELARKVERAKKQLEDLGQEVDRLEREIKKSERNLNRYNRRAIEAHNRKVDTYNSVVRKYDRNISSYNKMVESLNSSGLITQQIASVGGGIELSMKRVRVSRRASESQAIKRITSAKPNFVKSGSVQVSGEWVRSNP